MSLTFEQVKENLKKDLIDEGYDLSAYCCLTQCAVCLSFIALLIIGSVAAAGAFPGGTILGWTTAGLAGGAYLLDLSYGNYKKRKVELSIYTVATLILVTAGILGGLGQLSMQQLGWTIIGVELAQAGVHSGVYYFKPKRTSTQVAL